MGRPPKLTDQQKAIIGRRLAQGESGRSLAKEFKVSEATIRANVSPQVATIQDVAGRLSRAEMDLEALPISTQVSTRTLADHLKGITQSAAKAAETGMKTAELLQTRALKSVEKLDDNSTPEDLRFPDALLTVGNKATQLGLGLMAANKGAVPDPADTGKDALLRDIAAMLPN